MAAEVDFTQLPCAGLACFALSDVNERKRCSAERHLCTYRLRRHGDSTWKCRCCGICAQRCEEQADFMEKLAEGKDGCD